MTYHIKKTNERILLVILYHVLFDLGFFVRGSSSAVVPLYLQQWRALLYQVREAAKKSFF